MVAAHKLAVGVLESVHVQVNDLHISWIFPRRKLIIHKNIYPAELNFSYISIQVRKFFPFATLYWDVVEARSDDFGGLINSLPHERYNLRWLRRPEYRTSSHYAVCSCGCCHVNGRRPQTPIHLNIEVTLLKDNFACIQLISWRSLNCRARNCIGKQVVRTGRAAKSSKSSRSKFENDANRRTGVSWLMVRWDKRNYQEWPTSISRNGYFFLRVRTWNWRARNYCHDQFNMQNKKGPKERISEQEQMKRSGTLSIISGMNFCPPNPGSTVITRTISTGFSLSTCEIRITLNFRDYSYPQNIYHCPR